MNYSPRGGRANLTDFEIGQLGGVEKRTRLVGSR